MDARFIHAARCAARTGATRIKAWNTQHPFIDDRGRPVGRAHAEMLHTELGEEANVRVPARGRWNWAYHIVWLSWIPLVALNFNAIVAWFRNPAINFYVCMFVLCAISGAWSAVLWIRTFIRAEQNRAGIPEVEPASWPAARLSAAAIALSHARCGACGYDLLPLPRGSDGCVVCSECGSAWHTDRYDRSIHKLPSADRARTVSVELATIGRAVYVAVESDDRDKLCRYADRSGRDDGSHAASRRGASAARALRDGVFVRRFRWMGSILAAGLLMVVCAFVFTRRNSDVRFVIAFFWRRPAGIFVRGCTCPDEARARGTAGVFSAEGCLSCMPCYVPCIARRVRRVRALRLVRVGVVREGHRAGR